VKVEAVLVVVTVEEVVEPTQYGPSVHVDVVVVVVWTEEKIGVNVY